MPLQNDKRPHHERISDPSFRRAVDLLDGGNEAGLREYLNAHPELLHRRIAFEENGYFANPALLAFVADNPVRHGKLPGNVIDVTRVILDAGAKKDAATLNETLVLVSSGRVARECGAQVPLIDLLCDYGADPSSATRPALAHGEFQAVDALIRRGAPIDLPVTAALGRVDEARELLATAGGDDRHVALAFAAQFGRTEIVRLLLDAGENPNRFNPPGAHAHSTPLHQSAFAGHDQVVSLLVEKGARLDTTDTIWRGTPEDWARQAGNTEIAKYLKEAKR